MHINLNTVYLIVRCIALRSLLPLAGEGLGMRGCEYLKKYRFNLTSLTPPPLPPAGEGLEPMLFDVIFTLRATQPESILL